VRDPVLLVSALICSFAGFGWLALAMDVHWQQVRDDALPARSTRRYLRLLGGVAIGLSLVVCLAVDHATMASLVWVMLLIASSLSVAFMLTWRPRWLSALVFWIRPSSAPMSAAS
jgi:Protein of unknown function (DUF3325)